MSFISAEYRSRTYALDEFSYAMIRAVGRRDPVHSAGPHRQAAVPHELMHPHMSYLLAEEHTPEQLAAVMKYTWTCHRAAGLRARASVSLCTTRTHRMVGTADLSPQSSPDVILLRV